MADPDQIKRVLRRGIGPGHEEKIREEQLEESAKELLNVQDPTVEDLERIGEKVVGDRNVFRGTDTKTLTVVLREMRGDLEYTEPPDPAAKKKKKK